MFFENHTDMKNVKINASNQHLVKIAKIQSLERFVIALHGDMYHEIQAGCKEMAKSMVEDMCKHNDTIDKLIEELTDDQREFLLNNQVELIEGEGGSDYVRY